VLDCLAVRVITMSSNWNRDYVCSCGFSENISPHDVKGHWLSPECPKCGGEMSILPSRTPNFNKGRGSIGNKKFNNPDGEVASALKGLKRNGGRNYV